MTAPLIHERDEPIEIDVIIGCRFELRQILGKSVSGRAVRVPYTSGVRTKGGRAVIMQTPTICGEDPAKLVPDDYLPMLFYAPDADNLEFMIAYLSKMAYEQPVSKLTFKQASSMRATKEDYGTWKLAAPVNVGQTRRLKTGLPWRAPGTQLSSIDIRIDMTKGDAGRGHKSGAFRDGLHPGALTGVQTNGTWCVSPESGHRFRDKDTHRNNALMRDV